MQGPDRKADVARQFGRTSHNYAVSPGHAQGNNLAILLRLLEPQPDMHVLDVATGAGHTASAVAPHVRLVTAVDLTPMERSGLDEGGKEEVRRAFAGSSQEARRYFEVQFVGDRAVRYTDDKAILRADKGGGLSPGPAPYTCSHAASRPSSARAASRSSA